LHQHIAALEHQLEWFKHQLFSETFERRHFAPPPAQMSLGEGLGAPAQDPAAKRTVDAHQRRVSTKRADDDGEPALCFDARVPVETIVVPNPEMDDAQADAYEVIGETVTHRLARRPGSYVVLKYVRPLIKRKDDHTLHCPPAPPAVIEGGRADVSLLAGVLVDNRKRWSNQTRNWMPLGSVCLHPEDSVLRVTYRNIVLLC